MVRSDTVQNAKALLARVQNVAKGAALMTDTTVTWRQIDGTASTVSNNVIENVLHANMCAAPLPTYTEDEIVYAKQLRATYDTTQLPGTRTYDDIKVKKFILEATENGSKPINDFVVIHTPCNPFTPGSTDVGDVSWLTPTAQFNAATWPSNCPGHSWQMVSTGKTGFAHEAMLYAGTVLAMTAFDLMTDETILAEAKAEFAVTAAAGYDCPLEPDLVAEPAAV
jgi:aminobenzoyl-glutamate utilization protein B